MSVSFLRRLIILFICVSFTNCSNDSDTFNLEINASEPFYATYAAATERSSFLLDEGYEWHFYQPKKPIEFTTDTGGDLGVLWEVNGKKLLNTEDMTEAPIISETYADMVSYAFKPTSDLAVSATFFTKTSRHALWEFTITNESDHAQEIKMQPYIKNLGRPFSQVSLSNEGAYFNHQEYPDGWIQGHDLPHEVAAGCFDGVVPWMSLAGRHGSSDRTDCSGARGRWWSGLLLGARFTQSLSLLAARGSAGQA